MYTVYVIKSIEGLRYTGQSEDMEKRLLDHNSGMSKWTSRGTQWQIVYRESYETRSQAMLREKYLKTGKGRVFLESVVRDVDL